ncbi:MAG: hypothetical protein AAF611_09135 [Bacteroidota bacterium]
MSRYFDDEDDFPGFTKSSSSQISEEVEHKKNPKEKSKKKDREIIKPGGL